MAVPLTGVGGLFTRLGKLGGMAYALDQFQAFLPAQFQLLYDQYEAALQDVIGPVAVAEDALVRAGGSGLMSQLQQAARQTLLSMMEADTPVAARSEYDALAELIRQMKAAGASVPACTCSVAATAFTNPSNTGTGVVVTATKRGDGLTQENMVAESARLTCTADSYSGRATAAAEPFQFAGESPKTAGVWDYDYPAGSGASAGLAVVDPSGDADSSGNLLTNSDMEEWAGTPNALSNWTIRTGVWDTDAKQNSATAYRGTSSLEIVAGSTDTTVYQTFNVSTGTAANPSPLTSYAVNFWTRTKTGTASAGVLTVELVDGAGTVTADEQGVTNSFTVDLTALTTTWAARSGVVRVKSTPSTLALQLRVSTDLAGSNVLIDDLSFAPLEAAYPGGPGLRIFPGSVPFKAGDGWSFATTNNRAGRLYLATWQALFDRLFGMVGYGLLLPSSGSPTISDDLIAAVGSGLLLESGSYILLEGA